VGRFAKCGVNREAAQAVPADLATVNLLCIRNGFVLLPGACLDAENSLLQSTVAQYEQPS